MSEADREKWERRYAAGEYATRTHPSALLAEWLPRFPRREGARALDLACGTGRNALYLAAEGYRVDAMDISTVALERGAARARELGLEVDWIAVDLDDVVLPPDRYDLVVVARYVNRGLSEALVATLRVGGHLVCEEHLQTDEEVGGPGGQRFRLAPGELRRMFARLQERFYREGLMRDPDGPLMALAQLVACKEGPST